MHLFQTDIHLILKWRIESTFNANAGLTQLKRHPNTALNQQRRLSLRFKPIFPRAGIAGFNCYAWNQFHFQNIGLMNSFRQSGFD
ncbi:hypothetical protein ACPR111641_15610 [Acinetobacter pragensis]